MFTAAATVAPAFEILPPNILVIVADDLGYVDLGFLDQYPDDVRAMATHIAHPDYAKRAGYKQPVWDREAVEWEFPFWDPNEISWAAWHKKWGYLGEVDPLGRKRYRQSQSARHGIAAC